MTSWGTHFRDLTLLDCGSRWNSLCEALLLPLVLGLEVRSQAVGKERWHEVGKHRHLWGWGRSCKDVWASNWTLNYLQASWSVMQVSCRISWWLSPTGKRAPSPGAREADLETWRDLEELRVPHRNQWRHQICNDMCQYQPLSAKRLWLPPFRLLSLKQNFSSDPSQLCKEQNSGKCSPGLAKWTQYTSMMERKNAAR